jgi:hypothetical protein
MTPVDDTHPLKRIRQNTDRVANLPNIGESPVLVFFLHPVS